MMSRPEAGLVYGFQKSARRREDYKHIYVCGDLNDKITAEAQSLLDDACEEVMATFREEKSQCLTNSSESWRPGKNLIEDGGDHFRTHVSYYGYQLLSRYMQVLEDPTCFARTVSCYNKKATDRVARIRKHLTHLAYLGGSYMPYSHCHE